MENLQGTIAINLSHTPFAYSSFYGVEPPYKNISSNYSLHLGIKSTIIKESPQDSYVSVVSFSIRSLDLGAREPCIEMLIMKEHS